MGYGGGFIEVLLQAAVFQVRLSGMSEMLTAQRVLGYE